MGRILTDNPEAIIARIRVLYPASILEDFDDAALEHAMTTPFSPRDYPRFTVDAAHRTMRHAAALAVVAAARVAYLLVICSDARDAAQRDGKVDLVLLREELTKRYPDLLLLGADIVADVLEKLH